LYTGFKTTLGHVLICVIIVVVSLPLLRIFLDKLRNR
jgi:hypothetical protein